MADRDLCGRTLGEFVLRERIGEGGCGDVYRSSQPSLEREVVIKVLREPRRRNDDARERFLREAQLASRLDHPYAAHVYAFGVEPNDGLRWIAMELVQGITLDEWLRKHGPMPLDRFVPFFRCVAEVIQAAHERGIIHRDLKPANVMVMERGGRLLPKLVDFGLAKANQELARAAADETSPVTTGGNYLDDSASARETGTVSDPGASDWRLTPAGVGIGSWAYMSPEQWGNARDVGPASDIYSLGILAYRTLTGRVPFTAANEQEYREHHLNKPVPPLGGEFSPAVDRVLQRAMAKAPEARHPTALRFAAELRAAQRSSERELLRSSAEQWAARAQAPGLLWGGDVLADVDRWTRQAPRGSLTELECSFVAASRKRVRRSVWYRRLLIAAAALLGIGAVEYRSIVRAQAAEAIVTQAAVEQGRQALLHDELGEAWLHLAEAYRRGDHSSGTTFMLARAVQPRRAELASLPSTSGRMWYAAFSPNGRQVLTTDDRSAQVWDAATGQRLHVLPHGDTVFSAAYSADGNWFVTACGNGAVRIWRSADGTLVRELTHPGKRPRYYMVVISRDRRLVASVSMTGESTDVWDAETGALKAELANTGEGYPAIAFSDDTHWLAISGGDDVRVVNTANWQTALVVGSRIRSLSFDPSGQRIVTGAAGGDIAIWSIPDGARVRHLRELGESVDRIAWSPNGRLLAAASRDGVQQVFDVSSGAVQSQGNYLHGKIQSVEFNQSSDLILTAGANGTVVVADALLGTSVSVLVGPRGVVRVAHFDPNSRRAIGASWDGTARIWDATAPYRRWNSPAISDNCGVATSLEPDRRFVAVACEHHPTRVWDTARDLLLAELPSMSSADPDFAPALPAVSASGERAAVARGNTVEIYRLPGRTLLRTITHGAVVTAIAFAATGHELVSGAADGSVLVTNDDRDPIHLPLASGGVDAVALLRNEEVVVADARKHLRIYGADRMSVRGDVVLETRTGLLRPSDDGQRLIAIPSYVAETGVPALIDVEHHRLVATLSGHIGRVFSARFVRGDRELLTAGGDGAVRSWSSVSGRLLRTYRGSARYLADATLTPDGSMVIAGGGDGLLRFWDAGNGRPLWAMPAHKSALIGLHFEGGDIVTRGFGGDVARWSVPKVPDIAEFAAISTP